jgi:hypothetical protein
MDGAAVSVTPSSTLRLGKMFVSPAFDYLLIGGLLSWVAGGILYWGGINFPDNDPYLWWAILVSNWAHFAASTVRLYTKPNAVKTWPFLSVMYAYRSGSALETSDKRWILWACLIPFFWTLIHPDGGMALLLPRGFYMGFPLRTAVMQTLTVLSLVAPAALFLWLRGRRGLVLPMISIAVIVSNAIWWTLFNYFNAFVWATVFHGLQYLAIVSVFHIRDQERRASNAHGWFFHTATFYVTCLILGWVLFFRWPQTYWLFGFGIVQSGLLVTAIINIHHFVVDAFIWRLKRDPNYQTVVDPAPVPAPIA